MGLRSRALAAVADLADLPVAARIAGIFGIDVGVLTGGVEFRPVAVPFVAPDADVVAAPCRLAVGFAALLAHPADGADGCAVAAALAALGAAVGALLSAVPAPAAEGGAAGAVSAAVYTEVLTVLARAAVAADRAAFAACLSAVGADDGVVFTIVTVAAQRDAVAAPFAVRALGVGAVRAFAAVLTIAVRVRVADHAVGTVQAVRRRALDAQLACLAPFLKAGGTSAAADAGMLGFLIAGVALRAVEPVSHGAGPAHLAGVAPAHHASGAVSACQTLKFLQTRAEEALVAPLAGHAFIQMALQAGAADDALRAFAAALGAAVAEKAAVILLRTGAAVRAVFFILDGALHAQQAGGAPVVKAVVAAVASLADAARVHQTAAADLAVALLLDSALLAHLAVLAPGGGALLAQSAASMALDFLTVGREETIVAPLAGSSLFQVAEQAGAAAVQTHRALVAAVFAAVADLAAIFLGAKAAVRAVGVVFHAAVLAHIAFFTEDTAAAAALAFLADLLVAHQTVVALLAVALLLDGAVFAHMAVLAPLGGTLEAQSAASKALGLLFNRSDKAHIALLAGGIVFKMAEQAGAAAVQAIRAFVAAFGAAVTELASAFFGAGAAVRAVRVVFHAALRAHFTVIAPVGGTVLTGAAPSRAFRVVHIAEIALRAVAQLVYGALKTHMTGIAVLAACTVEAEPADHTQLVLHGTFQAFQAVQTFHRSALHTHLARVAKLCTEGAEPAFRTGISVRVALVTVGTVQSVLGGALFALCALFADGNAVNTTQPTFRTEQ